MATAIIASGTRNASATRAAIRRLRESLSERPFTAAELAAMIDDLHQRADAARSNADDCERRAIDGLLLRTASESRNFAAQCDDRICCLAAIEADPACHYRSVLQQRLGAVRFYLARSGPVDGVYEAISEAEARIASL